MTILNGHTKRRKYFETPDIPITDLWPVFIDVRDF